MVKTQFFLITFATFLASTTQMYIPLSYGNVKLQSWKDNALRHYLAFEKPILGQEVGEFDLFDALSLLYPNDAIFKKDYDADTTSNEDFTDMPLPWSNFIKTTLSPNSMEIDEANDARTIPDDVERELALKNEENASPEMIFVEKTDNDSSSENQDFLTHFKIEPQAVPYERFFEEFLGQFREHLTSNVTESSPQAAASEENITEANLVMTVTANIDQMEHSNSIV